jgi:hypothetical protein
MRWLLLLLLAGWQVLLAQTQVMAIRVDKGPDIDGRLDDPVWQKAFVVNTFYQREPHLSEPVSEKTEVLICYDQDDLYFGFHCYHRNIQDITAQELARDISLGNDDRVQIILDTFLDHNTGYWFQIGPRGSIGDALVGENGAGLNKDWDCLFQGKARIHDQGWDAEVAIPFKSITFKPGLDCWGLKLIRNIIRNHEASYWPAANLDSYRFQISDAGLMTGMQNLQPSRGLDLNPYGLFGVDQKIGADLRSKHNAGLDLFYQVTPGVKSALTVNTDFAQTEVDSRQINLTRFPLFFPEKRDFFLDGASYFSFALSGDGENKYAQRILPFFSRRIGLDANGNPLAILWGGKVTGQVGRTNIGLMHVQDEGLTQKRDFSTLRIRQGFGKTSSVGFIMTHGNALANDDNMVYGADLKLAGSTFRGNKNIAFQLYGLQSRSAAVKGHDKAMGIEMAYPNDRLSLRAGRMRIEKNFQPAMGFVPRANIQESYFIATLGPRTRRFGLLQVLISSDIDYITDLNNRLLTRQLSFTPCTLRFKSGDEGSLSLYSQYEFLDNPFKIYTSHLIDIGRYTFTRLRGQFLSAPRRPFWFKAVAETGDFYNGSRRDWTTAFGYKITVPLFVGMELEQHEISLTDGDFSTRIGRMNLNILFSPNVTLYTYIQYDDYSKTMGWQSRFRWIVTPGNEMYVTWNSKWYEPTWDHWQVSESASRIKLRYNYRF